MAELDEKGDNGHEVAHHLDRSAIGVRPKSSFEAPELVLIAVYVALVLSTYIAEVRSLPGSA